MKTYTILWLYLAQSFLEREIFQTNLGKKIKTYFIVQKYCVENCAVYEIMWENIAHSDTPQMTIWRMRIVCWISEATDTHSQYVILTDFPLQQWLH
jgi:hypothetical protein